MKNYTPIIVWFCICWLPATAFAQFSIAQTRWDTVKLVVPAFKLNAGSMGSSDPDEASKVEHKLVHLREVLETQFRNTQKLTVLAGDDKLIRELDKQIEREENLTNFRFPPSMKKEANCFSYVAVYFEDKTDQLYFNIKIVSFDRELWGAAEFAIQRERIYSSKVDEDFRNALKELIPTCYINYQQRFESFNSSVVKFETAMRLNQLDEVKKESYEVITNYAELRELPVDCLTHSQKEKHQRQILDNDSLRKFVDLAYQINFKLATSAVASRNPAIEQFFREVEQFNAQVARFYQMALDLPRTKGTPTFAQDYEAFLSEFDRLISRGIELARKRKEEIAPLVPDYTAADVQNFLKHDLSILDIILVNLITIRDFHFREKVITDALYTKISGRIVRNDNKLCEFKRQQRLDCPASRN